MTKQALFALLNRLTPKEKAAQAAQQKRQHMPNTLHIQQTRRTSMLRGAYSF